MTKEQALCVVRDLLILDEAFIIAPVGSPSWVSDMYWEQRQAATRLVDWVAEPLVAIGLARRTLYTDVEGEHERVTTLLCQRAPEIGIPLLCARTHSPDERVRGDALDAILKLAGQPQQRVRSPRNPIGRVHARRVTAAHPFAGLAEEYVRPLQQRMRVLSNDPVETIRDWARAHSELAADREEAVGWTHYQRAGYLTALALWSRRAGPRISAAKSLLELNRKLGLCFLAILHTLQSTRRPVGKAMLESLGMLLTRSEPLAQAWLELRVERTQLNQVEPDATAAIRRLLHEHEGVRAVVEALTGRSRQHQLGLRRSGRA
ncbi:MAG TPA: hypothetical protein VI136_00415 [Verrucomicrobiae bacterium]